MKVRILIAVVVSTLLLNLAGWAGTQGGGRAAGAKAVGSRTSGGGSTAPAAAKRVTLELNDVPILQALKLVSNSAEVSYAIDGPLPKELRATVNLRNADGPTALRLICASAGLLCKDCGQGAFLIAAPPRGAESPWGTGSFTSPAPEKGKPAAHDRAQALLQRDQAVQQREQAWAALEGLHPAVLTSINCLSKKTTLQPDKHTVVMEGRSVDVKQNNTSLREVIAQLEEESEIKIDVDESVPLDKPVSLELKGVSVEAVLNVLTQMFNFNPPLRYSVYQDQAGKYRVYLKASYLPVFPVLLPEVTGATGANPAGAPYLMAQMACPSCGGMAGSDWKFCCHCGKLLPKPGGGGSQ